MLISPEPQPQGALFLGISESRQRRPDQLFHTFEQCQAKLVQGKEDGNQLVMSARGIRGRSNDMLAECLPSTHTVTLKWVCPFYR